MHTIDKKKQAGHSDIPQGLIMLLLRRYYSDCEQLFYVESPHLDLVRAGKNAVIAQAVFDEALAILVEEWESRGSLQKRLLELGFSVSHNGNLTVYCAPETPLTAPPDIEDASSVSVVTVPYSAKSGAPCSA